MRAKLLLFTLLLLSLAVAAAAADKKKPVRKWTCQDFLVIDEQFQPKAFYAASAYAKSGKPDGEVIDIDGTEKVFPVVVDACKQAPKASFMQKVREGWKHFEAEAKHEAKKVEKKF